MIFYKKGLNNNGIDIKDEYGNVHISLGDYEVVNDLFQKYFAKKGNGAFRKMYEDEFQKFIIDR